METINKKTIYASNIYGTTNENKVATFKVVAPFSDVYLFDYQNGVNISIYNNKKKLIKKYHQQFTLELKKDRIYYFEIETFTSNQDFILYCHPLNNIHAPYEMFVENNGNNIDLFNNEKDSLSPALIEPKKRKGGTYIYCNVPESMPDEAINCIICNQKDLKGNCFLTFEVQNQSSYPIVYLGYRLKNNEDHDIYVTVYNIGYQVNGSWLGERSWMDYYGITYNMDEVDLLNEVERKWFNDYLGFVKDYKPQNIQPTTYRIPSGKSIFILGGTSKDNYRNINVNNTADLQVYKCRCCNANMLFEIIGGKADGEFVSYDDYKNICKENIHIQNLRKYSEHDDFGGRVGIANHHGVIDINPVWTFNDKTTPRLLPVKYYPLYADKLKDKYRPLEKVKGQYLHEYIGDKWFTHLSAQQHHEYVGSDMVEHTTICNNKKVTLSVNKATPAGLVWDYGNWMIEYQENLVFVNQGDKERTLKVTIYNNGSLFYFIKDENGKVLKASVTLGIHKKPIYEFKIKGHSKILISLQLVLPANDCGSIEHYVELI